MQQPGAATVRRRGAFAEVISVGRLIADGIVVAMADYRLCTRGFLPLAGALEGRTASLSPAGERRDVRPRPRPRPRSASAALGCPREAA